MENFGTIVAVIGAIIFIVSIWIIFGYLYFKKGSLKKGFTLLLVSLLLVSGGTFVAIKGAWNNAANGISLPQDIIEIIETKDISQSTQEDQAKVGGSVFLKINQEDWTKYESEILSYYIAWQKSLDPQANDESIKAQFETLREKSLLN